MVEIEELTLKRVKAISHGLKKLSLWLFKLHDVSNSSSQSTTVAVAPSTTASFVEFLATEFRRREPSVILEPFQRISTTNLEPSRAASGSRSQPWSLRTINLTMNFLETGGGHGHHFFILTTIGLFPFSHYGVPKNDWKRKWCWWKETKLRLLLIYLWIECAKGDLVDHRLRYYTC